MLMYLIDILVVEIIFHLFSWLRQCTLGAIDKDSAKVKNKAIGLT